MEHSIYFITSYPKAENLQDALSNFGVTQDGDALKIEALNASITDGDAYFLKQREGMLNFYSGLLNPAHMEVQSKFLMQLAGCVKAYQITFDQEDSLTPLINRLVDQMHGLVFSPNMTFYTSDWKVIIDANGHCDLDSYEVQMSAETFDSNVQSSPESEQRKQKSIAWLQQNTIPVLDSLPTVPASDQVTERSEQALANRIVALACVAVKGELRKSDISFSVLEKYAIHPDDVSPAELHFLQSENLDDQDYINAVWRYESLYVLLWAAGLLDELHAATSIAPVSEMAGIIRDMHDMDALLMNINTRDTAEILDELDKTYRLHWAVTDARVKNEPTPANINPSVVYERHYAFNWLINRYNEDWDAVSTPT